MNIEAMGIYYLKNFQRDFISNKRYNFKFDEKNNEQVKFESYLRERGVILVDYQRTITDIKYFEILTRYVNNSNKKNLLYTTYTLSYISTNCEFYSYNIPKNFTLMQFNNIYDYLFIHEQRNCYQCKEVEPYYYCVDCASYSCRSCVNVALKSVLVGSKEFFYLPCSCGKWNVLYTLPAHYTF